MRIVGIEAERVTTELSMEDLRAGDDALQEDLQGVISEMDAAADGLPGLWQPG